MKRSVAVLMTALLLAGCSSLVPDKDTRVQMSPSALRGTWQAARGGVLSFTADGTFRASDLPHQMFDGYTDVLPPDYEAGRDKLRASGKWELRAGAADPKGPKNYVYLHVLELFGHDVSGGTGLEAEQGTNGVELAYYEVDPDLNQTISYTKCSDVSSEADPPTC